MPEESLFSKLQAHYIGEYVMSKTASKKVVYIITFELVTQPGKMQIDSVWSSIEDAYFLANHLRELSAVYTNVQITRRLLDH